MCKINKKNRERKCEGDSLYSLAENPSTAPEILDALIVSDKNGLLIREFVARNPSTTPETLAVLATMENRDVKSAVALNRSSTAETLKILAVDNTPNDPYIRVNVARNISTPPETLAALAFDYSGSVVEATASNPSTPPEILSLLAIAIRNDSVKKFVASNPSTPLETLITLLTEDDERVILNVISNSTFRKQIADEIGLDTTLPDEWKSRVIDNEIAERYGLDLSELSSR